jgi:uncharacterized protein
MSGLIDFPWSIDSRGRTSAIDHDGHIRDLIEQVLLTSPGERVMRPDFGAGLLAAVFEPGGPAVAASAQYLVAASLERELGTVIAIDSVQAEAVEAALVVTVDYVVRRTGTRDIAVIQVSGGGGA